MSNLDLQATAFSVAVTLGLMSTAMLLLSLVAVRALPAGGPRRLVLRTVIAALLAVVMLEFSGLSQWVVAEGAAVWAQGSRSGSSVDDGNRGGVGLSRSPASPTESSPRTPRRPVNPETKGSERDLSLAPESTRGENSQAAVDESIDEAKWVRFRRTHQLSPNIAGERSAVWTQDLASRDDVLTRSPTIESSIADVSADRDSVLRDVSEQQLRPFATWLIAWGVGSLTIAIWLLATRFGFWWFVVRHTRATGDVMHQRIRQLQATLQYQGRIRVRQTDRLRCPAVHGLWRPKLLLPTGFAEDLPIAEQNAVLAHEIAHLRAADPAWQAVADAVVAILWWQPLVWWVRSLLRVESELAADNAAAVLPGGRKALATALLHFARSMTFRQTPERSQFPRWVGRGVHSSQRGSNDSFAIQDRVCKSDLAGKPEPSSRSGFYCWQLPA